MRSTCSSSPFCWSSFSSCCFRSVLRYSNLRKVCLMWRGFGGGRVLSSMVILFDYSYSEVLSILCSQYRSYHCLLPSLHFRPVRPDDRILKHVNLSHPWPAPTDLKLPNKIRLRFKFHDDWDMVFGRFLQDLVLRYVASTVPVHDVWCGPAYSWYIDHFANHSVLEKYG